MRVLSVFLVVGLGLAGEYAEFKAAPVDTPPSVHWGPARMSDLAGQSWGLYGLSYNGIHDKLTAVYFWHNVFHRYRSADTSNPYLKDTIAISTIPGQENDSFQDLAYCRYDNSIWVHSSKYKRVYKVDCGGSGVTRQFQSPALRYPTGIAFDERRKWLYLVDRMGEGQWPCSLYVTDTMGTVLRRIGLSHLPTSYAGARCLDLDYSTTNPRWPSLLMTYSFFRGVNLLDSCYLYELDPDSFTIIHQTRLPNLAGQVNNVRGVAWDPRSGDYWIGIMQNPDNMIYKMDGWHRLRTNDVGITGFPSPRITYNIGDTVPVRVVVRNFDTLQARTFQATMRFGDYVQTRSKTLAAKDEDTVSFPVWVANQGGDYVARCSLYMAGDAFPGNDTWSEPFRVVGADVGCIHISAPEIALAGDTIVLACSTYNWGTAPASYSVRMRVGDFYDQIGMVMNHPPATARYVTFPQDWVVLPEQGGNQVVTCSTRLAGDVRSYNNRRIDTVLVRVARDVAVRAIVSPTGVLDSGTIVTPACTVENHGAVAVSYNVRLKVGSDYNQIASVSNHPSGTRRLVEFPPFELTGRGWRVVSCSTELVGDQAPDNDRKRDSMFIRVRDVAIAAIVTPVDTVPDSTWLRPECLVRNLGNVSEPVVPVSFQIGSWFDSETVFGLAPGGTISVRMSHAYFTQPGVWLDRAEAHVSDLNPANNVKLDTFWVLGPVTRDVAVRQVLEPTGSFDTATTVTPRAAVTNLGENPESFWTFFRCSDAGGATRYLDSLWLSALQPGAVETVAFRPVRFTASGLYRACCSTALAGDRNGTNDIAADSFRVILQNADVAVTAIYSPVGVMDTMTEVEPRARWRNFGAIPVRWRAFLALVNPAGERVYSQQLEIAGRAGADTIVRFVPFNVGQDTGYWTVRCSTFAASDPNPANDVMQSRFFVARGMVWPEGWVEVPHMPAEPSGKAAKDGGWAVLIEPLRRIYVAKGNKTGDFYSFDPGENRWGVHASIPSGTEAKLPGKGGCAASDGNRYIYFVKGANTVAFWRFDIQTDSFRQLPDVPTGPSGKRIKGGTDMVYVSDGDSAYVYLLKGYKTEFYRFNVAAEVWEPLADAPPGASGKWDKGSWLVYDGSGMIHAHKGKRQEFYRYNTGTGEWDSRILAAMPLVSRYTGRAKKSGEGSSGAYCNGAIWALKGGNTQDWWRYDIATDVWDEYDSLPAFGSTGKKKRVKAGADVVALGNGAFFTAKGNKTLEYWRYFRLPRTAAMPGAGGGRTGQSGRQTCQAGLNLWLQSNPVTGPAVISWQLPAESPKALLSIYDAAGRCVFGHTVSSRESQLGLRLPAGVYLVRLSGGAAVSCKLVVR